MKTNQIKPTKHFTILPNTINIPAKKMVVFALKQVINMDMGTNKEMSMKYGALLDVIKDNPDFPEVLRVPVKENVSKC